MGGAAGRWPSRERRRGRTRRLAMGLATLLGAGRGFFIPHRYARTVEPCAYPALETRLAACVPAFESVLADIESHAARLERLRGRRRSRGSIRSGFRASTPRPPTP